MDKDFKNIPALKEWSLHARSFQLERDKMIKMNTFRKIKKCQEKCTMYK